jgi:hypothetical protein
MTGPARRAPFAVLVSLLVACEPEMVGPPQRACRSPATSASDAPAPPAYRACPLAARIGEFRVERSERFTAVSGSVAEAVVPGDVPELVEEAAGCRLLRRRRLACDPACGSGQTCGEGGRCVRYPDNLDAGTVTVEGLLCPVSMRPDPTGRRYWDTTLPHPALEPGARIHLAASGGDLPPFSLSGQGVAPLALDETTLRLDLGEPLRLAWQPGPPGPARVELTFAIDQHGVTPSTLVCEAADTGSFEIPAHLVGKLLAAGASGYPKLLASRQTVDRADLPPGCVELIVASPLERSLQVAGHTPCRRDADCPAGGTCNVGTQSCL